MQKLLLIVGSARKGNYTQHVAAFVQSVAQKRSDIQVEMVTAQSVGINFEDEGTQANYPVLREKVAAADAYVIISPEYNHSIPGSTAYMLDLNFGEYAHKPAGFVSVSDGPFGGVRMLEHLTSMCRTLRLVTIKTEVAVSNVDKEIQSGQFVDAEKWEKRTNAMLDELLWMSAVLKHGRENIQ